MQGATGHVHLLPHLRMNLTNARVAMRLHDCSVCAPPAMLLPHSDPEPRQTYKGKDCRYKEIIHKNKDERVQRKG